MWFVPSLLLTCIQRVGDYVSESVFTLNVSNFSLLWFSRLNSWRLIIPLLFPISAVTDHRIRARKHSDNGREKQNTVKKKKKTNRRTILYTANGTSDGVDGRAYLRAHVVVGGTLARDWNRARGWAGQTRSRESRSESRERRYTPTRRVYDNWCYAAVRTVVERGGSSQFPWPRRGEGIWVVRLFTLLPRNPSIRMPDVHRRLRWSDFVVLFTAAGTGERQFEITKGPFKMAKTMTTVKYLGEKRASLNIHPVTYLEIMARFVVLLF